MSLGVVGQWLRSFKWTQVDFEASFFADRAPRGGIFTRVGNPRFTASSAQLRSAVFALDKLSSYSAKMNFGGLVVDLALEELAQKQESNFYLSPSGEEPELTGLSEAEFYNLELDSFG